MSTEPLVGLIESPHHNGWIEFEYAPGDRISDLYASLEKEWGNAPQAQRFRNWPKSWALFYDSGDGTYIALKNNDRIPVRNAPPHAVELLGEEGEAHFGLEHASQRGILDVFFLRRYWNISGGTPEGPKKHYVVRFAFERGYEVPAKEYDCRLLALVAIVGG